jgi:hypothetical protein
VVEKDGGLRGLFRERLIVGFDWQSVESALTGGGIPDLNGKPKGAPEVWVEMKQTKEWAVTLEVEQVGWVLRRIRYGGRVFVAVRRRCTAGKRRVAADELWLLRGSFAKELKREGLRGCPPAAVLGVYAGGPSVWDWVSVRKHLLVSPT